jgi:2,3-bisphosphoglycerate-independent phosphoglycerate mutase
MKCIIETNKIRIVGNLNLRFKFRKFKFVEFKVDSREEFSHDKDQKWKTKRLENIDWYFQAKLHD